MGQLGRQQRKETPTLIPSLRNREKIEWGPLEIVRFWHSKIIRILTILYVRVLFLVTEVCIRTALASGWSTGNVNPGRRGIMTQHFHGV